MSDRTHSISLALLLVGSTTIAVLTLFPAPTSAQAIVSRKAGAMPHLTSSLLALLLPSFACT